MTMDKVRFSIGADVFQGYHDKGDHGMVGALVFVTADTLRQVTEVLTAEQSDFDRLHNAPTEDWATLAFGEPGAITAPDGVTPLYRLTSAEPAIVQRFNPDGGRTYEDRTGGSVVLRHWGVWENEETIDNFIGGSDPEWEPICHGFVIDPVGWAEGRGDAPPIDTEASREARVEGKQYVVDVLVPITTVVRAGDEEMAASIALERLVEQGVIQRIHNMVDEDDSDFMPSDSAAQTEVGEA